MAEQYARRNLVSCRPPAKRRQRPPNESADAPCFGKRARYGAAVRVSDIRDDPNTSVPPAPVDARLQPPGSSGVSS